MHAIRAYFERLTPLDDSVWADLEAGFVYRTFQKGECLLAEGQDGRFIGFLREGVVRFYRILDGQERITAFWFPGAFLSNYRSFVSGQPSDHYMDALSDGAYWRLEREVLQRLYDRHPRIERLGRLMAEQLYLTVAQRLDGTLHASPEARYRALLDNDSRLLREIPQFMIASYLGVSAESLSRIRKRIAGGAS